MNILGLDGKRFGLVVLGVVLSLVVVEAGFRTVGGVMTALQKSQNRFGLFRKGTYRILCLGESTTRGAWPQPLEKELNTHGAGVVFKVIDEGGGGVCSAAIVSRCESLLAEYKPDMVVVMMGINDGKWVWGNPVEYKDTFAVRSEMFLKNMRLNKLRRFIEEGLMNKFRGATKFSFVAEAWAASPDDSSVAEPAERNPEKDVFDAVVQGRNPVTKSGPQKYLELGDGYFNKGDFEEAEKMFEAAIRADPQDPRGYLKLGRLWRDKVNSEKAEKMLEAAIRLDPRDPRGYLELGILWRVMGNLEKAEKMFEAAIKVDAKSFSGYMQLGTLYRIRRSFVKAEKMFETAIRISPQDASGYLDLGITYRCQGKNEEAARTFYAAIEADPKSQGAYAELARIYRDEGDEEKLENILKQAFSAKCGDVTKISNQLFLLYTQQGKIALAEQYRVPLSLPSVTIVNYQKLRDLVLGKGVKLVCMQYPMRSVESLREALGLGNGMIFVENKKNFEAALKTHKLTDIFGDMFGGDFGHCSPLGNQLIARGLADVIMQEVYGRRIKHSKTCEQEGRRRDFQKAA